MLVLLDENLPVDLAIVLARHEVSTVAGLNWQGLTNGELLRRAQSRFDVLVTMDGNLEFQQNIAGFELGIILIQASSNRMANLRPLVSDILETIEVVREGELRKVGA